MRGVIEENFGFGVDGALDGLRALADSVGSVTAVADLIGGTSVEATVNATLAEDNLTLSDFQTGGRFDDLHRQQLHDAVVEEIRVSTDNTEVVSAITDQTDTTRGSGYCPARRKRAGGQGACRNWWARWIRLPAESMTSLMWSVSVR